MNGIDIVRDVYRRLRRPSQQDLPYQVVADAVRDVVARKRLDLALSSQNQWSVIGDWFTPTSTDFELDDVGDDVFLPLRIETRAIDSDQEIGDDVPIVNYEVLNTSTVGAAAFYGDPMRLTFAHTLDYVTGRQYRIVYQEDVELIPAANTLNLDVSLPNYFLGMCSLEAAYDVIDSIENESPEWDKFKSSIDKKWPMMIEDRRIGWDKYVKMFRGRAQVPKRTFWDNRACAPRTRFFKG